MRAVFDANVLVSATLSPAGAPAELLRRAAQAEVELILSPLLMAELEEVLDRPRIRARADARRLDQAPEVIRRHAWMAEDPDEAPTVASPDPDDAYLIALAESERAALVTGDKALLSLAGRIPVFSPAGFLDLLRARD